MTLNTHDTVSLDLFPTIQLPEGFKTDTEVLDTLERQTSQRSEVSRPVQDATNSQSPDTALEPTQAQASIREKPAGKKYTYKLPWPPAMSDLLSNVFFAGFLLIVGGACLAFQAGCNGTLGGTTGRSFAAIFSFGSGSICCLLYFLIDVYAVRSETAPNAKDMVSVPWWGFLGGILGTYYVIVNILTVPKLGAGVVLSVFVCSQIIFACIIDHFALVGVPQRTFTLWRGLGVIGLVGSVAVITKF
ncbi:hypothetical protein BZG36_00524 [Bifiguratus adelaidae]|uniref:EamA domain-containing protein n=1 Tax=Bifiguratus adelaidae TaxID=1938954 RepID=A0A261Y7J4_9FUNG|nr:hypothetical protein BZG36_00524 [Bifiguratus adelaidae]